MKVITIILFLLSINLSPMAQKTIQWDLKDSINVEVYTLIDSIWMEVVSWDGDTSISTREAREKQARMLEMYASDLGTKEKSKALLYTFFIRFRNNDSEQIIQNFERLDIDAKLFAQIYPIYSSCLRTKFDWEDVKMRLDSIADAIPCGLCKVPIWSELGRTLVYKDRDSEARIYFQKVVAISERIGESEGREVVRAKSFLRKIDELRIGDPLKPFIAEDINGEIVQIQNDGIVTLIDFWATWCRPCVQEMPTLKRIYEKYGKNPEFRMIGVSLDQDPEKLVQYLSDEGIAWSQINEQVAEGTMRDGKLVALYNGYGLPTYYLMDREGRIRYNFNSRREGVDLEELVDKVMSE